MPARSGGELSELQRDALKELGNIGAGNATTALSQMLGDRMVRMQSPRVDLVRFSEVVDRMGAPDQVVVVLFLDVTGGLEGRLALVLPVETADTVLMALLGRTHPHGGSVPGTPMGARSTSDLEVSALLEVGNIVITAYLNALGEMTSLTLVPSVPAIAQDMLEAVLASMLADLGDVEETVLSIQTRFTGDQHSVDGQLLFLPNAGQLARMLAALGVDGEGSR